LTGWPDVGRRADTVALGDHVTRTTFALAALGGDAQLKLDLVKAHASAGVAGDVSVRNSTADANDHGQTFVVKRTVNDSADGTVPLHRAWLNG
jgi:hypothetical protein